MSYYLRVKSRGRWQHWKWTLTAFLEAKLPNGKTKIYRVKQEVHSEKAPPNEYWYLTAAQIRSLINNTSSKNWRLRYSRYKGQRKLQNWGTPNLKGERSSVQRDIGRKNFVYNSNKKYIHVFASYGDSYDLRPRFSLRLLSQVPKKAKNKNRKLAKQEQIPRFGEMTYWNVGLMTKTQRMKRKEMLQNVRKLINARLKSTKGAKTINRLKKTLERAEKEMEKIENYEKSGFSHARIR